MLAYTFHNHPVAPTHDYLRDQGLIRATTRFFVGEFAAMEAVTLQGTDSQQASTLSIVCPGGESGCKPVVANSLIPFGAPHIWFPGDDDIVAIIVIETQPGAHGEYLERLSDVDLQGAAEIVAPTPGALLELADASFESLSARVLVLTDTHAVRSASVHLATGANLVHSALFPRPSHGRRTSKAKATISRSTKAAPRRGSRSRG